MTTTEARGRRVAEMVRLLIEHDSDIERMEIGRVEFNFGPTKVVLSIGHSFPPVRLEHTG